MLRWVPLVFNNMFSFQKICCHQPAASYVATADELSRMTAVKIISKNTT